MRYIPNTPEDREFMLREIGVSSFEELLRPIPEHLRMKQPINLPEGLSERDVVRTMTKLSDKNLHAADLVSFLGAGCYEHFVPAAVADLAGRSEYLTAYTPYQPEVSQGTLQVIYEFQSMICELFAMDAANASVYDGGTALAEAVMLAFGYNRKPQVLWPDSVHPHYRKVTRAITEPSGLSFASLPLSDGRIQASALDHLLTPNVAAVVFQYPNFFGIIEDLKPLIERVHAAGALAIVVTDPLAMGVLKPPGRLGADIAVGEGQCLGNVQSYGGPFLGLFSAKKDLLRRMPGRIAGITNDVDGRRGFVLTLQTREQHIRRDKATSNICTNEGLCAARATFYLSLLGPQGLCEVGRTCMNAAAYLKQQLSELNGVRIVHTGPHFKEFAFALEHNTDDFLAFMTQRGILPGIPLKRFQMEMDNALLVAVTECRTKAELDDYVNGVRDYLGGLK